MALLLARVERHQRRQLLEPPGDVEKQVRVLGKVHLVGEKSQRLERLETFPARRRQHVVHRGEGGAVVAAHFERRGQQHQIRLPAEQDPLHLVRQRAHLLVERAVVKTQSFERGAEPRGHLPGLGEAALAVGHPFGAFYSGAPIAEEKQVHRGPLLAQGQQ